MRTGFEGHAWARTDWEIANSRMRRALRMRYGKAMHQHNMKLLSQHTLNGHGGMGEGMSMQLAKGGRRVLWLPPERAPEDLTPGGGHGGMGEGMSMQLAKGGRRVLWLAHESAPKNFTAVDVTDPRSPKVIVQTDLPHRSMRSNSLETVGD